MVSRRRRLRWRRVHVVGAAASEQAVDAFADHGLVIAEPSDVPRKFIVVDQLRIAERGWLVAIEEPRDLSAMQAYLLIKLGA